MFIIEVEVLDEVWAFVSIIFVNSLIGSILHHTISITIVIVTIFVLLALIVFIFHKSSIVHKSWLLNFSLLKVVLF